MEEKILVMLKKLINTLELEKIESISEKTIMFDFRGGVRLFIDSTSKGIDLSLIPMADEAVKIIDDIEKDTN